MEQRLGGGPGGLPARDLRGRRPLPRAECASGAAAPKSAQLVRNEWARVGNPVAHSARQRAEMGSSQQWKTQTATARRAFPHWAARVV